MLMRVSHVASEVLKVRVAGAQGGAQDVIEVTPPHPLYVEGHGWMPAAEIQPGMKLRSDSGPVGVEAIEPAPPNQPVYNIEVGLEHDYRVSSARIWAHNTCTPKSADLKPYGGQGGGHHVPAKSAFRDAAGYDANAALAVPNAEMARLGVSHGAVTGAQATLYRAFAKKGVPLTWKAMSNIETEALIRGGMSPEMAKATVAKAIDALKEAGVAAPTRIPWGQ